MDSTQNFDGFASNYAIGRPTYADTFLQSLYQQHDFSERSVIADIGSGTGKFAKQLLDRSSFVYGVEPNDDMRNTAVRELGMYERFHSVNGTAENTTLENSCVDFITTAQAFHWFDTVPFKQECKRILKPGGTVFLIWNNRDMANPVNQHSFDIFSKYCPRFQGFSGGIKKDDPRIREFFDGSYGYAEYDNPLFFSREKFISRSLSGSYSLKAGEAQFEEYLGQLSSLFDRFAENDVLFMANKTVAYWGTVH